MSAQVFHDSGGRAKRIVSRRHGTHGCYVGGCRRPECTEARRLYEVERQERLRLGLTNRLVSATRARGHLQALSKMGLGTKRIARASGVAASKIGAVRSGQHRRIREETERALLAVTLDAHRHVPAGRYQAMVDEMVALGYPKVWIAERVTWQDRGKAARPTSLQVNRTGSGMIFRVTAQRIEELYEALRANGWLTAEHAAAVRRDRSRFGPKRTVRERGSP